MAKNPKNYMDLFVPQQKPVAQAGTGQQPQPDPMDAALSMPTPDIFQQMMPALNQAQLHSVGNRYAMGGGLEDANALRGVDAVFANSPLNPEVAKRQSARFQQMGREAGGDINQRAEAGRAAVEAQKLLQGMQQPNVVSNDSGMKLALGPDGQPVGFSTPGSSPLHQGPERLKQAAGQFFTPAQSAIQNAAEVFAQPQQAMPQPQAQSQPEGGDFMDALARDKANSQPTARIRPPIPSNAQAASARQQAQPSAAFPQSQTRSMAPFSGEQAIMALLEIFGDFMGKQMAGQNNPPPVLGRKPPQTFGEALSGPSSIFNW